MATMPEQWRGHPVLACAERLRQDLCDVTAVPVELMTSDDKAAALLAVSAVAGQLEALRLRLLAAADDVALDAGAHDAGAWLAHETRGDRREQQRDLRLATALSQRWHDVDAGLSGGSVNLAQARVIVHALDELPEDVPDEVVRLAERQLVEYAADFGPRELRVLGRRILDVVAPEIGEAAEARALEREERRATETTALALTPCGDGTTRLQGRLPDAVAHRLATYLDAYTSPRKDKLDHPDAPGPLHRRRGQAFCALLEHLDPAKLPIHGGEATTVMVTMTLDQLRTELATAAVISSDDLKITAGEARRLACNAAIVPAVLGGRSEVLNLGRTSRLFSRVQRKAMRLRDRRCRAEGCTVPAPWCEAHHLRPWALGGSTDLDDGVLLCSFHHHRAHDPRYRTVRHPGGDVQFHRLR